MDASILKQIKESETEEDTAAILSDIDITVSDEVYQHYITEVMKVLVDPDDKNSEYNMIGYLLTAILPKSMTKSRINCILGLYPKAFEFMEIDETVEERCRRMYYELLHYGQITDYITSNITTNRDDGDFFVKMLKELKYDDNAMIQSIMDIYIPKKMYMKFRDYPNCSENDGDYFDGIFLTDNKEWEVLVNKVKLLLELGKWKDYHVIKEYEFTNGGHGCILELEASHIFQAIVQPYIESDLAVLDKFGIYVFNLSEAEWYNDLVETLDEDIAKLQVNKKR